MQVGRRQIACRAACMLGLVAALADHAVLDPLPQQVQLGPAVAHALDQLHPGVLALHLSCAPRSSEGCLHGVVVAAKGLAPTPLCLELPSGLIT